MSSLAYTTQQHVKRKMQQHATSLAGSIQKMTMFSHLIVAVFNIFIHLLQFKPTPVKILTLCWSFCLIEVLF